VNDIFEEEQKILDDATVYLAELKNGAALDISKYDEIVKEYRRLLRQLRRVTKLADRASGNLNEHKHDLLDKVHFDALTGIYNRRFMEDALKRITKSLARSGGMLSLLMIDVDYFKKYNDGYGHSEGDACLKAVAETIAETLSRPDDFAARYGGEEFAVILPNTDESGARYVAGRLLENIREKNISHEYSDVSSCVTISIGVTSSDVERTHKGDDYIRQADKALYQSKQKGRNRYTYIDFKED
jgi:diguanylate cyclase (GGDEF)-like protein